MGWIKTIVKRLLGAPSEDEAKGNGSLLPELKPVSVPIEATNRRYGRVSKGKMWHDFGGPIGTMSACGVSVSAVVERSHVVLPEYLCKRCKKANAES